MTLQIQRESYSPKTTVVTMTSAIAAVTITIRSPLPPRGRRTLAVEFIRYLKPFLKWIRTSNISHFDVWESGMPRAQKEIVTLPKAMDMDSTTAVIGFEIRVNRYKLGLTQEQLAIRARISRPHLSLIERGLATPRDRTLDAIREALRCEFNRNPPPFTKPDKLSNIYLRAPERLPVKDSEPPILSPVLGQAKDRGYF